MNIGELILLLRGNSDKLDGDFKNAEGKVRGFGQRISASLSEAMNFAIGQVIAQGLNQLAAGIENMARETINLGMEYTRQVEEMARLTGTVPEQASRIIQVADDMRLSYSDLTTALTLYSKSQKEAGGAGRVNIDVLARLSDEYLKLKPGIERTNFLLKNFGRSGTEMGMLMEQGGRKIREMAGEVDKSLIITQEGIDQAREYEKALEDWNEAIEGIKLVLFRELLPYLVRFSAWLRDEGIPLLTRLIDKFVALPDGAKGAIFAIGGLIILLVKLGPAFMGIAGIINILAGGGAAAGGAAGGGGLLAGLAAAFAAVGAPVVLLTFLIGVLLGVIIVFGPKAWAVFKGLASLWLNIVVGAFKRMVYEIKAWLNRWIADFKVAVKFFTDIGKSIVDGIWKGIQGAWTTLKTNVSTALDSLLKWIQDKLKAHSPSLVFAAEVGRPMAEGIGVGFNQALKDQVQQAMTIGIQGLTMASAGPAQNISVGHVEYHGRFSQSEISWLDARQEDRAQRVLLRSIPRLRR
jgi:hypothetical protein